MKTIRLTTFVLAASTLTSTTSLPSLAAEDMNKMDMKSTVPATSAMTEGEVKKIDKDAGKITLKHGPIANLQMPGMTMVFRVADPAMLERVKEGDKIKFHAEKRNGAITVTLLQTE